jgi:hypothetical protein
MLNGTVIKVSIPPPEEQTWSCGKKGTGNRKTGKEDNDE